MSDLISREALIECMIPHLDNEDELEPCVVIQYIKAQPGIDAAPVVHGEWLFKEEGLEDWLECSVCGHADFHWKRYNFCPCCGADTRGEQNAEKRTDS